jgi:methylmalonyl-CoA mutase
MQAFKPSTKEEWVDRAKIELEGISPFEKLTFDKDGIRMLPYYAAHDLPKSIPSPRPSSGQAYLEPNAWYNLPLVEAIDEVEANKRALQALNSGADGIFFHVHQNISPSRLLKDILVDSCALAFTTDSEPSSFFFSLFDHFRKNKIQPSAAMCFWQKPPAEISEVISEFPAFRVAGFVGETALTPAMEVATFLSKAVRQIDSFIASGLSASQAMNAIAASCFIGQEFYFEIAKLKAWRRLWNTVATGYGLASSELFIHAVVPAWKNKSFEPCENMISAPVGALSAILGGCDGLTINPGKDDPERDDRIARNASSILREESHLGKVSDPTAGSFFIETLTDTLARDAWTKFQGMLYP